MEIKCYRDLLVWQKAIDLVINCYELTTQFPKSELYGLSSQIRRAAVSIPANIAEGHGRDYLGDFMHHLSIAAGSLMELETHIIIAGKLKYLDSETVERVLQNTDEISRMLKGLKKSLQSKSAYHPP